MAIYNANQQRGSWVAEVLSGHAELGVPADDPFVAVLIDDEEATLKRLRRRGNSVALEAANPAYETRIFPPDRVKVQGRLVGLLRKY